MPQEESGDSAGGDHCDPFECPRDRGLQPPFGREPDRQQLGRNIRDLRFNPNLSYLRSPRAAERAPALRKNRQTCSTDGRAEVTFPLPSPAAGGGGFPCTSNEASSVTSFERGTRSRGVLRNGHLGSERTRRFGDKSQLI